MEHFAAFEDGALVARLERLKRAEEDLAQRVMTRITQAEAEGRWLRSDPLYQRLSSILKKVREDLRDTEDEVLRRDSRSTVREIA